MSPPHSGTAPPYPEAMPRYCLPSSSQVTGIDTTPEPVWNFHNSLPFVRQKL